MDSKGGGRKTFSFLKKISREVCPERTGELLHPGKVGQKDKEPAVFPEGPRCGVDRHHEEAEEGEL